MREQPPNYYFGLDIGTSAVRCVVGTVAPSDPARVSVIGHGSAPNIGMRRGVIAHVDDVVEAVVQAVTEAERVSGVQIAQATVNVNGSHVSSMNSKGVIAVSAVNREISASDRLRAEEAATIVQIPANREIIQVFAKNYRVDGQDNIKDPIGMHGVRLEVDTHIVTAATPNLRSLDMVLEKARITRLHRTVSSLAAAEAVLSRQQKEAGTLLLDIGAGTTNIVVVEDGEVQHVAVVPMGGKDITNDLAIGLKTDLDIAEQVKLEHGAVGEQAKNGRVNVQHGGRAHYFDKDGDFGINNIIEARVEHILDFVEKELKKIHRARKLPGGVVLVGGTAKLPGIAEFTREQLQLPARLGTLQPLEGLVDTVQDQTYTSAVGLMLLDMLLLPSLDALKGEPSTNFFGVVESLFRRFRK